MKATVKACVLLAVVAAPVYAQSGANQPTGGMNCPMMTDAADMQKQMGAMMNDMRAMMEGSADPATKTRMQAMHERMNAMMANMQKMQGMMRGPAAGTGKANEPPAASPPAAEKEDHEAHHPGK
jgi:hypothetical protein